MSLASSVSVELAAAGGGMSPLGASGSLQSLSLASTPTDTASPHCQVAVFSHTRCKDADGHEGSTRSTVPVCVSSSR
jgi:hypothetical protein